MESYYTMISVFFIIGGILLLLALLGRNPRFLGSAVGRLQNSKRVMVWTKHSRKKVPVTTFVYLYEVNGKTYRLKRDTRSSRKSLMPRVTVVYLKGFPRFGYLEKYPSWQFALIGATFLGGGAFYLLMPYL